MADSLIEQFCRAHDLSNLTFLRRCQREFRDRIQPMLDEREILKKQVEELLIENEQLRSSPKRKGAA